MGGNARPKNSRDWVKRHLSDPYVKKAQEEGFRSRSVYKLQQIAGPGLFKPGMTVVDLGSAPGGWSQWAVKQVGAKGKVVSIDLLPMEEIPGVLFIQDDFSSETGLAAVEAALEGRPADLVISDMAPNLTGIPTTDQARLFGLAEMAMEFAVRSLKPEGVFLVKVFQGAGFEPFVKEMRNHFRTVAAKKPDASREESRETFLLGKGRKEVAGTQGVKS